MGQTRIWIHVGEDDLRAGSRNAVPCSRTPVYGPWRYQFGDFVQVGHAANGDLRRLSGKG
jgi:hypothetical protein